MPDKMEKVYLDTNLIIGFFKNIIRKKKKTGEDPEIIKFLAIHDEIKKFISIFSIAEIIESLEEEFPSHALTQDYILDLIETLRNTIELEIIEDVKVSKNIINYTYLCRDVKDAIHIDICQASELWFITRDEDCGKVSKIYNKIMSERKFRKQFE